MTPRRIAAAILSAWGVSLFVAAWQVHRWQDQLSRVLIQLQAYDLVQAKTHSAGKGVRPGWYRDHALALIESMEQLHGPSRWNVVMPGSWGFLDDLEARVDQRIRGAFGQVVVDAVRRGVERRAARITGVALHTDSGTLDTEQACRAPVKSNPTRQTLDPTETAEYEAMASFLAEASRMDQAMASLRALRDEKAANPRELERVIRYSLEAELSGSGVHSAALFRANSHLTGSDMQFLTQRLARALRCTAAAGMAALVDRTIIRSLLLESERVIAQSLGELVFPPQARIAGGAGEGDHETRRIRVQRLIAQIDAQRVLLASARSTWMQPGREVPVTAFEGLLRQIARIGLLGPELSETLRDEIVRRQRGLHASVNHLLRRPDAGLVWNESREQFLQSQQRVTLHTRLRAELESAPPCTVQSSGCPLSPSATPRAHRDNAAEVSAPASTAD